MTTDELAKRLRAAGCYVNTIMESTDESGAAEVLGCSPRTLSFWREEGNGPGCYRTAKWHYPLQALIDFMQREYKNDLQK